MIQELQNNDAFLNDFRKFSVSGKFKVDTYTLHHVLKNVAPHYLQNINQIVKDEQNNAVLPVFSEIHKRDNTGVITLQEIFNLIQNTLLKRHVNHQLSISIQKSVSYTGFDIQIIQNNVQRIREKSLNAVDNKLFNKNKTSP